MTYLKKERIKTGLTQEQVAQKANISISIYMKYEQGQRNTSGMALRTALALKDILNLDLQQLNQPE